MITATRKFCSNQVSNPSSRLLKYTNCCMYLQFMSVKKRRKKYRRENRKKKVLRKKRVKIRRETLLLTSSKFGIRLFFTWQPQLFYFSVGTRRVNSQTKYTYKSEIVAIVPLRSANSKIDFLPCLAPERLFRSFRNQDAFENSFPRVSTTKRGKRLVVVVVFPTLSLLLIPHTKH